MTDRDRGAGTALALAVIAAVVLVFLVAAGAAVVLEAHRRVVAAADAAALGGADVALGNATGTPCSRAAELVVGAGLRLDRCEQRGVLVRVRASTVALGIGVSADALAGPPRAR